MQPDQSFNPHSISERSPAVVLILILVTCGLYLIYWYYQVYEEIRTLKGNTPTGLNFWVDFLICVLTGFLWGLYVDFKIADSYNEIYDKIGMPRNDTVIITLLLDLATVFSLGATFLITCMIHQDQMNKIRAFLVQNGSTSPGSRSSGDNNPQLPSGGPPATGGSQPPSSPNPYS